MTFQIPEDLSLYSAQGISELLKQANAEFSSVFSQVDPITVTDEQLEYIEALQTFKSVTAPTALGKAKEAGAAQAARTAAFTALTQEPETPAVEPETEADPEPLVASTKVTLADVVNAGGNDTGNPHHYAPPRFSTLVAAAGVPDLGSGEVTLKDVARALDAAARTHINLNGPSGANGIVQMTPLATISRDYDADFTVTGSDTDQEILDRVRDERRLPGGDLLSAVEARQNTLKAEGARADSLVAAAGWCAPSETDYSICMQISTDGMADFPEVQAKRGGIRHNTGLSFNSVFGGGTCATGTGPTGFFNLTEAQVASGTTKTCLEIPCPSFVDTRLGVTGLCLTGNILSIRGYPEMTETFTRGAVAASAHQVNREQIATVVAASTAVTLTGSAPWATDGSTVSQVMSAVEMAAVDIKYNLRMQRSATLEVKMPWWILAQMRADFTRRPYGASPEAISLADSQINAMFALRGVRVDYVYDWQDAFATCAVSGAVGAATPITSLPSSLQFLMYPAGTWVRAVNDVITLNSVYDSTKLATNQVTHLFTETGWAMLQMCPVSRVYTINICPSGVTTLPDALTCPS
jgi:rRNA maturation protein Nop10